MSNYKRKTTKGLSEEEDMREAVALVEGGLGLRRAAGQKGVEFQTLARVDMTVSAFAWFMVFPCGMYAVSMCPIYWLKVPRYRGI